MLVDSRGEDQEWMRESDVDSELFETQELSSWFQRPFISAPTLQAIALAWLANSEVAKATKDSNRNVTNTRSRIKT